MTIAIAQFTCPYGEEFESTFVVPESNWQKAEDRMRDYISRIIGGKFNFAVSIPAIDNGPSMCYYLR